MATFDRNTHLTLFKPVFATIEQWAKAVKEGIISCIGYAVETIAAALKTAYNASLEALAFALKTAEFGLNVVAKGLNSVVGTVANAVTEVGNALVVAFNATTQALGVALDGVGYAWNQVSNFFTSLGGSFLNVVDTIRNWLTSIWPFREAISADAFAANNAGAFLYRMATDRDFGEQALFRIWLLTEGDWDGVVEVGERQGFAG